MTKTWAERACEDASLRAFVDAEIARAHVELQALRVEFAHLKDVIGLKQREIDALHQDVKNLKRKKAAGRTTEQAV